MVKKVIEFKLIQEKSKQKPTDEDILECLNYAKEHPNESVNLTWIFWSMAYNLCFDDVNTLEEAKEKMPKKYYV